MAASSPASFRTLVLPREHGSWSLALEPVVLGLAVAPSWAGAALAGAVVAGFFTRRPLKLAVSLPTHDRRRAAARLWLGGFALLAVAALAAAGGITAEAPTLWPLLLAVPLGAAFLWFDLRNEMRAAEAELCGSAAFACVPAAFATLAGWPAAPALGLAALMLARAVPTVLAVRAYLRLRKGQGGSTLPAIASSAAALAAILVLADRDVIPFGAAIAVALLCARTLVLLHGGLDWSAKRVGIFEAGLGVAFLVATAAAYWGQ